jgi:hypothetical protein
MSIVLRPISALAAEYLRARVPRDVAVASDYPTEFSFGVGQHAGESSRSATPWSRRAGAAGSPPPPCASSSNARAVPEVICLRGHTPLGRPASGRVLDKAGFARTGEVEDEHEGVKLRLYRWELALRASPPA